MEELEKYLDELLAKADELIARVGGCKLPCYDMWHQHADNREDFLAWEKQVKNKPA